MESSIKNMSSDQKSEIIILLCAAMLKVRILIDETHDLKRQEKEIDSTLESIRNIADGFHNSYDLLTGSSIAGEVYHSKMLKILKLDQKSQ